MKALKKLLKPAPQPQAPAVPSLEEQIAVQENHLKLLKSQQRLTKALELHGQVITPVTAMSEVFDKVSELLEQFSASNVTKTK